MTINLKILWEEKGERDIHDIKKIAIGKDYFQYEKVFSLLEFVEFMNFQQNRTIPSEINVINISVVDTEAKSGLIQEQNNPFFTLTHNKEANCYDLILKKKSYEVSAEMIGLVSFIHQLGVLYPNEELRIGAMFEEQPKLTIN